MKRTLVVGIALALAGCGGSSGGASPTAPYAPPPAPAKMAINYAAATEAPSLANPTDVVSLALSNSGGSGSFYLEFWGRDITVPTGCFGGPCPPSQGQRLAVSQALVVAAGYSQAVSYTAPAMVTSVRVFTSQNGTDYVLTDCKTTDASGACP